LYRLEKNLASYFDTAVLKGAPFNNWASEVSLSIKNSVSIPMAKVQQVNACPFLMAMFQRKHRYRCI